MTTKSRLALAIGFIVSTSIHSGTSFAEEHFRQHDAHVHGQVEFNIAQDGHDLLIEITAPGADVVGFEHSPKNNQQQQQINTATETLSQANAIFTLNSAAQCKIETAMVNQSLNPDSHKDEHDHHSDKHDDDKHDSHAKHEHDQHDHDHDHDHHHDQASHGAFTIEYHYHCDDLAKLNSIETQWFKHFPNTNLIQVNLLTDQAQTATELTADKAVIAL